MNKSTFVVLATLFAAPFASAADWYLAIIQASTESIYFIDKSSIKDVSGKKLAWVKIVSAASSPKGGVRSTITRYAAHCKGQRMQIVSWADYDKNGAVIYSSNKVMESEEVIPESVGEALHKAICIAPKGIKRVVSPESATDSYFAMFREQAEPWDQK